MSIELHIFMSDAQVPTRNKWQQAIDQLGFPTTLDPTLDLREDKGFSPTTFRGQDTGFEFDLEPAAEILSDYEHIAAQVGSRDQCATFRWGSNMLECGAAISAAAALAQVADGLYFYPMIDIVFDADEAVVATRNDLTKF